MKTRRIDRKRSKENPRRVTKADWIFDGDFFIMVYRKHSGRAIILGAVSPSIVGL